MVRFLTWRVDGRDCGTSAGYGAEGQGLISNSRKDSAFANRLEAALKLSGRLG